MYTTLIPNLIHSLLDVKNGYTMTTHFPCGQWSSEFTDDTALAVEYVHSETAPNFE